MVERSEGTSVLDEAEEGVEVHFDVGVLIQILHDDVSVGDGPPLDDGNSCVCCEGGPEDQEEECDALLLTDELRQY